jgi:hypothetical protein
MKSLGLDRLTNQINILRLKERDVTISLFLLDIEVLIMNIYSTFCLTFIFIIDKLLCVIE